MSAYNDITVHNLTGNPNTNTNPNVTPNHNSYIANVVPN